jgi:hypothetical protein
VYKEKMYFLWGHWHYLAPLLLMLGALLLRNLKKGKKGTGAGKPWHQKGCKKY